MEVRSLSNATLLNVTNESVEQSHSNPVVGMHDDILKRCVQDDEHAQMQIYHLYYRAMFNSAKRILGDSMEAEDVMQEAFLAAFEQLNNLDELASFPAWLKSIVIRRSLNQLKKRQTYQGFLEEAELSQDESSERYDEFSVEQIRKAINSLPDGYRVIINLFLIEGYDHEEISEILDISSSTSRSQYARGKKKLRQILIESK